MNYNDLLAGSIKLAAHAHASQRDLHGAAYILHPLRVRQSVEDAGYGIPYQVIAVLHDVLEDQPRFLQYVADLLPDELFKAVEAVSRDIFPSPEKEAYKNFIHRCIEHPLAVVVKFFDVIDNFNVNRMHHKIPVDRYRWALTQILRSNPELADTIQTRHYDDCPDLIKIVNENKRSFKDHA